MKGEGEGWRVKGDAEGAFGPVNALVVTSIFINVAFDEACIHWRCSLAVERRTRNAKVPSSTLGSAFFSKLCQPFASHSALLRGFCAPMS